jgi:phosphate transport system permease protein
LERLIRIFLWASALFTIFILIAILGHIIGKGLHAVNLEFLLEYPRSMGREGGISPAIVGTVYLTAISILIASPIGIGAAVYLTEYARKGRILNFIRFSTETLAGIPSIIFGLFGYVFFVIYMGFSWSLLSGRLTLAFMILPTIVRTSEEAIRAVPDSYREGSLSLGATRWQTTVRVVLPSAISGIVTGIILSIGRAVGETAAVFLTAGSSLRMPTSIMDPARTMSVHLYVLAAEGISLEKAYATATVLVVLVLMINLFSTFVIKKVFSRGI